MRTHVTAHPGIAFRTASHFQGAVLASLRQFVRCCQIVTQNMLLQNTFLNGQSCRVQELDCRQQWLPVCLWHLLRPESFQSYVYSFVLVLLFNLSCCSRLKAFLTPVLSSIPRVATSVPLVRLGTLCCTAVGRGSDPNRLTGPHRCLHDGTLPRRVLFLTKYQGLLLSLPTPRESEQEATRNKKLLEAPGIATSRGSWHRY